MERLKQPAFVCVAIYGRLRLIEASAKHAKTFAICLRNTEMLKVPKKKGKTHEHTHKTNVSK